MRAEQHALVLARKATSADCLFQDRRVPVRASERTRATLLDWLTSNSLGHVLKQVKKPPNHQQRYSRRWASARSSSKRQAKSQYPPIGFIMLNTNQSIDDLKAFERRLIEIIACYQPRTKRWQILLLVVALSTTISAFFWLNDPETPRVSFIESLYNHLYFAANCLGLLILLITGIHKKVNAPAIIVSRIREVLDNFNMSCDQSGRLILKRI